MTTAKTPAPTPAAVNARLNLLIKMAYANYLEKWSRRDVASWNELYEHIPDIVFVTIVDKRSRPGARVRDNIVKIGFGQFEWSEPDSEAAINSFDANDEWFPNFEPMIYRAELDYRRSRDRPKPAPVPPLTDEEILAVRRLLSRQQ